MISIISRLAGRSFASMMRRLAGDRDGSILIMLAIGLPTIVFATGFGIDFSRAENAQTQLNAIADAASLAAVDPSMLYQTDAVAQAAATAMFNTQAANVQGVTNIQVNPVVSTGTSGIGGLRNVTVSYTAQSTNLFGGILGLTSLAISGTSGASASQPPNINFYVMVDNSPSMLIPSTATGITQLQATTSTSDGGCAFTCHNRQPLSSYSYQVVKTVSGHTYSVWIPDSTYTSPSMTGSQSYMLVNTSNGNVYDPGVNQLTGYAVCSGTLTMATVSNGCNTGNTISGQWADGYWAVENYSTLYPGNDNITLRIDDASSAVQQLAPYAYSTSQTNQATYAIQAFFFNNIMSDPGNIYPSLPSGVSYISGTPVAVMTPMTTLSSANSLTVPTIPVPRWITSSCVTSGTCPNGPGAMTDFRNMFSEMNTYMPNPGNGSANSTPQEVLFLITDGYDDDQAHNNRSYLTSTELAECSTIKARGIKIAIIYTQYLASSVSAIYPSYASVLTPTDKVAAALQSCASTNSSGTPLYYQVSQNESITPALQQLFASVVQSAHLTQ